MAQIEQKALSVCTLYHHFRVRVVHGISSYNFLEIYFIFTKLQREISFVLKIQILQYYCNFTLKLINKFTYIYT